MSVKWTIYPDELLLTTGQNTRLRNAINNNMSVDIKRKGSNF